MGFYKKGKQKNPFILIEKAMLEKNEWVLVGQVGRDIYLELKRNYNGFNNGDLIASYGFLRKKYRYGFKTISNGFKRLIEQGFIELKQRGELEGLTGMKPNKYELSGKHEKIR